MTGWLLDTNIVTLLAPSRYGRPKWARHLREWVRENTGSLFLSVVSVVEISAGIRKLRREGWERQASEADIWLDRIIAYYGERILAVDAEVGRLAGELVDEAKENKSNRSLAHFLIAATTQAHGLVLLTNDAQRFQPLMPAGQLLPLYELPSLPKP